MLAPDPGKPSQRIGFGSRGHDGRPPRSSVDQAHFKAIAMLTALIGLGACRFSPDDIGRAEWVPYQVTVLGKSLRF